MYFTKAQRLWGQHSLIQLFNRFKTNYICILKSIWIFFFNELFKFIWSKFLFENFHKKKLFISINIHKVFMSFLFRKYWKFAKMFALLNILLIFMAFWISGRNWFHQRHFCQNCFFTFSPLNAFTVFSL